MAIKPTITMLLYGDAKVGKSTLAATAPGPVLVFDTEGSWANLARRVNPNTGEKYQVTDWEPDENPPDMTGYDVCVVDAPVWSVFDRVLPALAHPGHPFTSIVVDSLTEVQENCKEAMLEAQGKTVDKLRTQDWGTLLDLMKSTVKQLRNIVKAKDNPAHMLVATTHSSFRDGKFRPTMQGKIQDSIAYTVNSSAYLATGAMEEDGTVPRFLLVGAHSDYVTGSHFEDLYPSRHVKDPNLTELLGAAFPDWEQYEGNK